MHAEMNTLATKSCVHNSRTIVVISLRYIVMPNITSNLKIKINSDLFLRVTKVYKSNQPRQTGTDTFAYRYQRWWEHSSGAPPARVLSGGSVTNYIVRPCLTCPRIPKATGLVVDPRERGWRNCGLSPATSRPKSQRCRSEFLTVLD